LFPGISKEGLGGSVGAGLFGGVSYEMSVKYALNLPSSDTGD
jgi:hypothetical protein